MSEFIVSIDRSLFLLFNKTLSNPLFDAFFPYITERQNWYIPILAAITVFLVKARDRKKAGIVIGLAILTIAITNPLCISILNLCFIVFALAIPPTSRTTNTFFLLEVTSYSVPRSLRLFRQLMQ